VAGAVSCLFWCQAGLSQGRHGRGPRHSIPDPDKVEKLKADLKEQQEEVATLETELKDAQDRQVDFDLFQAAHQELSAKFEKLKSQKANSEATAALDNSIASLDARLARGQDLLYAVSDFWRRKAEAEKPRRKSARSKPRWPFTTPWPRPWHRTAYPPAGCRGPGAGQ